MLVNHVKVLNPEICFMPLMNLEYHSTGWFIYSQLKHCSESLATACFSLLADHLYMDKIREIYLPVLQINLIFI